MPVGKATRAMTEKREIDSGASALDMEPRRMLAALYGLATVSEIAAETECGPGPLPGLSAFDALPVAVIVHIGGAIEYANPAAARLIGVGDASALIGEPLVAFAHPAYRERLVQRLAQLNASPTTLTRTRLALVLPSGDKRFVESHSASREHIGRIVCYSLAYEVAADPSRKGRERPSDEIRNIVGAAGMHVFRADPHTGRVLEYSEGLTSLFGGDGDHVREVLASIARPALAREREALAVDRRAGPSDLALPGAGGETLFLKVAWCMVEDRSAPEVLAVVRDETASRREQFAVRQRLDLFERMFRASPVASTLVALADGRHVDVNDAWIRLFGRLREEIVGRTGVAAGIWAEPGRHRALLDTLQECGRARGFRARLRRADGEAIDTEISAETLTLNGEQCVLWKIVDVTRELQAASEIRRLNQTLEARVAERTEQLNAANEALQAFSYSVSHDLRAPARRMRSFASVAADALRQGDTAAALAALERIERSGANLEQLVEALMTLSQVGRKPPEPSRVDLSRIAVEVLEELRAGDTARAVDIVLTPGILAIADPVLARVLLQNLLSNAWKYTRDAAPARIEFARVRTPAGSAFCVRDNGAGFDPAYSSRLFRPFSRLHSESEFPGSGIGLATVARIVASHGGKVWAEGRPGEGASFYFTLPERTVRDGEAAARTDS